MTFTLTGFGASLKRSLVRAGTAMGVSHSKFICPGCNVMRREGGHRMCDYDVREYLTVKKIQAEMVRTIPRLASVSPSELMQRLWDAQKKTLGGPS